VEFRKGAVELVVERSGGHPYFLQEYGRELWDEIDSPPVTAVHVRTVEEIVEDSFDRGFFAPASELATFELQAPRSTEPSQARRRFARCPRK
jgi:hypothetical protein